MSYKLRIQLKLSFFFLLSTQIVFSQAVDSVLLKKHISFLASDNLKGRGTSSEEEQKAAKYIASQFKEYKLIPKGTDAYMQDFTFKKNANPHDTGTVNIKERKGTNVIGYIDNGANKTIVIGAHYDHLGMGFDYNSLDANPENKIHNGADDNASGTAGVLELARILSTNNKVEKNNYLFICFSGEELGLIGSKKFCEKPTIPIKDINCMLNMDMIGRLNDSTMKLMIYGMGTSPTWGKLLEDVKSPFSLKLDSAGIGPSDQTSFYLMDIPVLHFFTGQHTDYHKPSDDADKINYTGEKKVLEYILNLIYTIDPSDKLAFQKTRSVDTGKSNFKVTMGVMPDYAFEGKGMRIDGVTDGKPANKAGLLKGDIVVELGDVKVANMTDYMQALSKLKKGDTTNVSVMRGDKIIKLPITF